jgi:hypothetical protein
MVERRIGCTLVFALEAGRPLAFVGGQLLWISQPVLGLLLPSNVIGQTARLLENPEAVTALIENLEARA